MVDPIADTLIRIKNGYMVRKPVILVRYSKVILTICHILVKEGFLESCDHKEKDIEVKLKYQDKIPVLKDVKRISKPGLRVYKGKSNLPKVLGGLGIAIISTPKGIMTDKQARKNGLGGEIMAEVW